MRETGRADNDLLDRLAADERLAGLDRDTLAAALAEPLELTGTARDQVTRLVAQVDAIAEQHPEASGYTPGSVL